MRRRGRSLNFKRNYRRVHRRNSIRLRRGGYRL